MSNMTIINLALHACGPMREDLTLTLTLILTLALTLTLTLTLPRPDARGSPDACAARRAG